MRKIEKEMLAAIVTKKRYSNDNTLVEVETDGTIKVYLHSNLIAEISDTSIWLSDAGYESNTTKSRLNCILSHFDQPTIYSKNYQWRIGSEEWTGQKTIKYKLQVESPINEPEPRESDAVLGGQKRPYDLVLSRKVQH